jgi:hypothetical protein
VTDDEVNELMSGALENTRVARPMIKTAMVRPETIFSERDIFMVFLGSEVGVRKSNASDIRPTSKSRRFLCRTRLAVT